MSRPRGWSTIEPFQGVAFDDGKMSMLSAKIHLPNGAFLPLS